MLIYVLRWQPSWISDWHTKQKLGKELEIKVCWLVDMCIIGQHLYCKYIYIYIKIAITWRPSSVDCKLFTFQASSPKPLGHIKLCPTMMVMRRFSYSSPIDWLSKWLLFSTQLLIFQPYPVEDIFPLDSQYQTIFHDRTYFHKKHKLRTILWSIMKFRQLI
jgi:hypothetical protein